MTNGGDYDVSLELTLCYDCLSGFRDGSARQTPAELFGASSGGSMFPVCRDHCDDPWYVRLIPLEEGKALLEVSTVLES